MPSCRANSRRSTRWFDHPTTTFQPKAFKGQLRIVQARGHIAPFRVEFSRNQRTLYRHRASYGSAMQLGASFGVTMAQCSRLPPQQGRILLASGAAAAIAASFNTPLAGMLFAHEVILGKFTLRAVAPVVIAAVVGTAVTRFHSGIPPYLIYPPPHD